MASFNDKKYPVEQLSEITSSGFDVALFPQIRDALTRKMMEIYGNDIDVSSASADGQYIQAEANIINNIYRMLERIVSQLNPSSASDNYLDILASYNNVFRQTATYSKAKVWVLNLSSSPVSVKEIRVLDKNGVYWIWYNPITLDNSFRYTFDAYDESNLKPVELEFTCETIGKVEANGSKEDITNVNWAKGSFDSYVHGDIYTTISGNDFYICQSENAVIGEDRESDYSLRARRIEQYGNNAITVMESLKSNLLALGSVQDAYVITNNTENSITNYSNVTIAIHDVFVVIRIKENTTLPDIDVAKVLYRTLTPGVMTKFTPQTGLPIYGEQRTCNIELLRGITTTYMWKEATPFSQSITISGKILNNTQVFENGKITDSSPTQLKLIKNSILNYLNKIKIGEVLSFGELTYLVQTQDLRPNNIPSFYISGSSFTSETSPTPDAIQYLLTYFEYNTVNIGVTGSTLTITITKE
jgi:hypothetical protein